MHERKIYAIGHKIENLVIHFGPVKTLLFGLDCDPGGRFQGSGFRVQGSAPPLAFETASLIEIETWIETDYGFLLNNCIGMLFAVKLCWLKISGLKIKRGSLFCTTLITLFK